MKKIIKHYWALITCVFIGALFWICPAPSGLTSEGWHLLGVFVATILGIIIKPLPMGAVTLLSLTILLITHTLNTPQAFSGFTNPVVWLVVMAFFIAKGFGITGLGARLAHIFTYLLGKKTLGLSYGLALSDLIMAPGIPSATARSAGIIYPVLQGITHSYESYPHSDSARKIGAFLTVTAFQVTVITSAMFMTAMAANPLLAELTRAQGIPGLEITWGSWALAASVPGMFSLILIPLFIYFLYPPVLKDTPQAPLEAMEKLRTMGKMSKHEWIMLLTMLGLLVLWCLGSQLAIPAVVTAMLGLCVLLVTGVLNWNALIKESNAWETLVWFGALIMMATQLNEFGVITWGSNFMSSYFLGMSWVYALPLIGLFYFYSHYLFASSTAHVSAMYVSFLMVLITLGAPPMLAALVLIFISSLFGGITHYSLAPGPLLYGAGFVNIKTWWLLGFLCSLLNITIWTLIGIPWWKFLGLW